MIMMIMYIQFLEKNLWIFLIMVKSCRIQEPIIIYFIATSDTFSTQYKARTTQFIGSERVMIYY